MRVEVRSWREESEGQVEGYQEGKRLVIEGKCIKA